MYECEVVRRGAFLPGMICADFSDDRISFTRDECLLIEEEWKAGKVRSPELFDGPLANLQESSVQDGGLHLKLNRSSYKEYVGTSGREFRERFGSTRVVNPLSTGASVITSDRKLIFGRRRNVYLEQARLGFPAGYVDPDIDSTNGNIDVFSSLKRELNEEIGIVDLDIKNTVCLGLAGKEQTYMAFVVELMIPFSQVIRRFHRDVEFDSLEGIDTDSVSIRNFATSQDATRHCIANIIFYGASKWGEDWLDQDAASAIGR